MKVKKMHGLIMEGVTIGKDQLTNATVVRCEDCNTMLLVYQPKSKNKPRVYNDIECCDKVRIKANV